MKRLVAAIALLLVAGTWGCPSLPDSRPATLDEERRILEARETIAFAGPNPDGHGRLGTAIILIDTDPEKVWDLLTDYSRYNEFFPRTRVSRELVRNRYNIVAFLDFKPLWTYPFWAVVEMEEDERDDEWIIRWKKDMGPIKTLEGYWTIERYGDGTKLTFHNLLEVDQPLPGWVWEIAESILLPQAVENVRTLLEEKKEEE